jgi:hypothetical protein
MHTFNVVFNPSRVAIWVYHVQWQWSRRTVSSSNQFNSLFFFSHLIAVIQAHGHTAETAVKHIATCRAFVRPNVGYTEQLEIYSEANCDVKEATAQWIKRKDKIALSNDVARRGLLASITSAGPRISGWFRRKTRASREQDRHGKMRIIESNAISC